MINMRRFLVASLVHAVALVAVASVAWAQAGGSGSIPVPGQQQADPDSHVLVPGGEEEVEARGFIEDWYFESEDTIYGIPSFDDFGNIYFATSSGSIFCVDEDEILYWQYSLPPMSEEGGYDGDICFKPAVSPDGTVYITNYIGYTWKKQVAGVVNYLIAIGGDGEELWREKLGAGQSTCPIVMESGTIVIGHSTNDPPREKSGGWLGGTLSLIDNVTGVEIENPVDKLSETIADVTVQQLFGEDGKGHATIDPDFFVISGSLTAYSGEYSPMPGHGEIRGYHPDGKRAYKFNGPIVNDMLEGPDGKVLASTYVWKNDHYEDRIYCLSAKGGKEWITHCGQQVDSQPAFSIANNMVYAYGVGQKVYMVTLDKGKKKWDAVPFTGRPIVRPVTTADGGLVFAVQAGATGGSAVYKVVPAGNTGRLSVLYSGSSDAIMMPPVLTPDDNILVTIANSNAGHGRLVIIDQQGKKLKEYDLEEPITTVPVFGPNGMLYVATGEEMHGYRID